MRNLILTLDTDEIVIEFGSALQAFRQKYSRFNFDEFKDQGATLQNFLYSESLGLEIIFNDGILSSFFLYIHDSDNDYSRFLGKCSELGGAFWNSPSLSAFENMCEKKALVLKVTKSEQTTCYDDGELSLVYTQSSAAEHVYYGFIPFQSF